MVSIEPDDIDTLPDAKPYRRLWAAVFKKGISDACTAKAGKAGPGDARLAWFYSDAVFPGSFVWLCHLFDLTPDSARTSVMLRWRSLVDKTDLKGETNGRRRPRSRASRAGGKVAAGATKTDARPAV